MSCMKMATNQPFVVTEPWEKGYEKQYGKKGTANKPFAEQKARWN
jgi:hypothetical protein